MKILRLILFGMFILGSYAVNAMQPSFSGPAPQKASLADTKRSAADSVSQPTENTGRVSLAFLDALQSSDPTENTGRVSLAFLDALQSSDPSASGSTDISPVTQSDSLPRQNVVPLRNMPQTTYQPRSNPTFDMSALTREVAKNRSISNLLKLMKEKISELPKSQEGTFGRNLLNIEIQSLITNIQTAYDNINDKKRQYEIKKEVLEAFYDSNVEYFFSIFGGQTEENFAFVIAQKSPQAKPQSYINQLRDFYKSKILTKPTDVSNPNVARARFIANTALDTLIMYKLISSSLENKWTSKLTDIWPGKYWPSSDYIKATAKGTQAVASLAAALLMNRYNIAPNKLISSTAYLGGKAVSAASDLRDKILC